MNISTASLSGGFISKFTHLWGDKWRNRKVIHFLKSQGIEFSQCYEIYTKKKHFLLTLKKCYFPDTGFLVEPLQLFLQLFSKYGWNMAFIYLNQCVFSRWFQNWLQIYCTTNGSPATLKKLHYFEHIYNILEIVGNTAVFSM